MIRKQFVLVLLTALTVYIIVSTNARLRELLHLRLKENHRCESFPCDGHFALTTFLAGDYDGKEGDHDDDDTYFVAARILTYQLLHAPRTRLQSPTPFIVLVTKDVRESKRQRLRDDGASVVEVDQIEHNISISEPRWVQTITKLRVFDPTAVPYSTVLYLDTDIVLTRPIDSIFSDPSSKKTDLLDYATGNDIVQDRLPEKYTMAASPESGKLDHPYPYLDTEQRGSYFNSGFFVYSPSTQLFEHYMSLLKESEAWDRGFPDQDLLNYAHRLEGPMPWQKLHFSWHLNWPNDNDLNGGMSALHAKWWKGDFVSPSVKEYALSRRWEMERYWMGRASGCG
ncbi:hypothetical protein CNMCM5878_004993 [Aspergillus fumigatiaffinis]|nr:hypothetical protein CNMCM5878_004993 [Aspergillus fumigatiaffinis]